MFRPDQKIGPYLLVRKIGRGGFGEVWLAEKRSQFFAKKVAIKLPHDNQVNFDAICQEATLWEQASGHPNVLPIIDADVYDGQIVIVSEYASGGSLFDKLIADGSFESRKAVEMTLGILSGLGYLHSQKIIHRDIKPQNILLQGDIPRLADFGISRAMQTTAVSAVVAGTDAYMSPEAFDGKRNVQTDIWSVGVVLYQLLLSALPFPQEHPSERMFAILTREFEPLPSDVPIALKDVVTKALAKAPDRRYQSAEAMREDLRSILEGALRLRPSMTEILPSLETPSIPTKQLLKPTDRPPLGTTRSVVTVERTEDLTHSVEGSGLVPNGNENVRRSARLDKATKFLLGLAIGLALLIVAMVGMSRMVDLGSTNKNDSLPNTAHTPDIATVKPSDVPLVSPTAIPSPIPTRQIQGRYSGGYFNLDVKRASERGFTFWLHPGNDHGIGEIEGQAFWKNSASASYVEVNNSTLSDNETGVRRKCRIDFNVTGDTIKVSESNCVDWHGQSPTYNGTYKRKSTQ